MKVAVIGSRNIEVDDLGKYIPDLCDEIVSGGAKGGMNVRECMLNGII